jgi:hypothetical protein
MIGLIACSDKTTSAKDRSFAELMPIPFNEMNDEITLTLPNLPNEVYVPRLGDFIELAVNNRFNEVVVFPSDYGVGMYLYNSEDEQWAKIKNLANYYPTGNRQVSPKGDNTLGQILISAIPDLPITSNPVELRVVVIGTVYHDGVRTNKQVGAYIDITLQP